MAATKINFKCAASGEERERELDTVTAAESHLANSPCSQLNGFMRWMFFHYDRERKRDLIPLLPIKCLIKKVSLSRSISTNVTKRHDDSRYLQRKTNNITFLCSKCARLIQHHSLILSPASLMKGLLNAIQSHALKILFYCQFALISFLTLGLALLQCRHAGLSLVFFMCFLLPILRASNRERGSNGGGLF
jgi:hypothetical protein